MRGFVQLSLLAIVAVGMTAPAALACHKCKQADCVVPVQPAYECVTEMVPYTVMKTRWRTEYTPVEKTVMVREPVWAQVDRQRTVCRPVYETTYVQKQYTVTRPVYDTTYVEQQYTVCRPVTTAREVTMCVMQPYSQVVTVAASSGGHCGLGLLCGKRHGRSCGGVAQTGCVNVVQTCYQPTMMTRTVYETQMVNEVATRQVPVRTCRMVTEARVENVPIRHCRMVREVITEKVPVVTGYRCVPKTITRMVPHRVCETVPVTCYKKVTRMVPVCATETILSSSQAVAASGQGATASEQATSQFVPTREPAQPAQHN